MASQYKAIAGFEANRGYLLGSDIEVNDKVLKALPTRDAVLFALTLLSFAKQQNTSIRELVESLPERYSYSDHIQNFAMEISLTILVQGKENPDELLTHLGMTDIHVSSADHEDAGGFETAKSLVVNTL